MSRKLRWMVFSVALVAMLAVPAVAMAAEATGGIGDWGKPMGAALAIGLAALGAGWAQSKIGSAGQATLAERPEERIWVIALTVLPEIIALLGFVMAILINTGGG